MAGSESDLWKLAQAIHGVDVWAAGLLKAREALVVQLDLLYRRPRRHCHV